MGENKNARNPEQTRPKRRAKAMPRNVPFGQELGVEC
jgi:hypothetical protein